jgi:serine/threonine-protein kinase
MQNEEREAPIREGEVLAGKYRVEKVLGAGGMGVVVAAHHLQLEQHVALKFVRPEALSDTQAAERFMREARLAAKLKSEHVAKVLDVGTLDSGAPYMVMEFLDGQNLAEVLQSRGPLPVEAAADYIVQACEALSEAHALGIVHRDLKPQNLFLTKGVGGAPLVKVLDFGISKAMQQAPGSVNLTQTSAVMGSPLYMAPEQLRSSRNVDPRADIWALGVVLYELLTAHVPFVGESMTDLAIKVAHDPYVPVDRLRAGIPPELAAIVTRCLEKAPEKRFADAAALAVSLEPFATPEAKLSVHRARMVSGAYQQTLGAHSSVPPPPQAAQGFPAATPAPWSGTGPRPAQASRRPMFLAGGVVIALGLGIAAWASTRSAGPGDSGPTAAGAPSVAPPPEPPLTVPTPTLADPTAATAKPPATGTPAASGEAAAASASAAVPAASASAAATPATRPAGRPKGPADANRSDDDIPSLR